jgi:hypothetical protein
MGVDGIGEVGDRASERLLGCMGQVLQQGLWQGKESGGTRNKISLV